MIYIFSNVSSLFNLSHHSGVASGLLRTYKSLGINMEICSLSPIQKIISRVIKIILKNVVGLRYPESSKIMNYLVRLNFDRPTLVFDASYLNPIFSKNVVIFTDFMMSDYVRDYENLVDGQYEYLLERDIQIMLNAKVVFFRSRYYASLWSSRVPSANIKVCPAPSNLSFLISFESLIRKSFDPNNIVIGYIGKEPLRKNFIGLIALLAMYKSLSVVIVGPKSHLKLVPDSLIHRVVCMGSLDKSDTCAPDWITFFESIDFGYVCPSSEAYGLQAVEFQTAAKPLICNFQGGLETSALSNSSISIGQFHEFIALVPESRRDYYMQLRCQSDKYVRPDWNTVANEILVELK